MTRAHVLLFVVVTQACSSARRAPPIDGEEVSPGGSESSGSLPEEVELDTGTPSLDLPPGDPDDIDETCVSVSESAAATRQPADVLFVIDNSGSMGDEAMAVQANMNAFSAQIIASGVDAHVALISGYPSSGYGVCIDPPLGAGGCPSTDTNLPGFNHVNQIVNSNDALLRTLATKAQWLPYMRSTAAKHLIVVTDDNSSMAAEQFDEQFSVIEPSFADYKFHGIVSASNCPAAAVIGTVYMELAESTGGLLSDLCLQDFNPVFDLLSTEVIQGAALACRYDIPPSPDGMVVDPSKVNVDFDDGSGLETIGYVELAEDCDSVSDGWHYDDPNDPKEIVACPQTCKRFQNLENATIEIRFGCATVVAG